MRWRLVNHGASRTWCHGLGGGLHRNSLVVEVAGHVPRDTSLATVAMTARSDRVKRGEAGPADLTVEHSELVTENQDLCVLGGAVHPEDPEQFDDAADQAAEEGGRETSLSLSWLVKLTIE